MEALRKGMLGDFSPVDDAGAGRVPEPVEATFRHVLNQLSGIGMLSAFSEEEITSALLGGFAAAYPLCLGIFTDSVDEQKRIAQQSRCSWGQYSKSRTRTPKNNETDRGADFALVVWTSEDRARVALFQAKRFEGSRPKGPLKHSPTKAAANTPAPMMAGEGPLRMIPETEHFIDLRRARYDATGHIIGATQMVALARTGGRIRFARALEASQMKLYLKNADILDAPPFTFRDPSDDETSDDYASDFEVAKGLDELQRQHAFEAVRKQEAMMPNVVANAFPTLDWIHYLGYARSTAAAKRKSGNGPDTFESGTVCVSLPEFHAQHAVERTASGFSTTVGAVATPSRRNLVDLASVNCFPLINVILNAFSPGDDDVPGWISLDANTIEAALPFLQQFGHVFMGTDKGGVGHALIEKLNLRARSGVAMRPGTTAIPSIAAARTLGARTPAPSNRPS